MNFKPTNNPATNGPLWRGVNESIVKPVLILWGVCARPCVANSKNRSRPVPQGATSKQLSTVNYKKQ
jgi:hypothetical protein